MEKSYWDAYTAKQFERNFRTRKALGKLPLIGGGTMAMASPTSPIAQPTLGGQGQNVPAVPFRQGTLERVEILPGENFNAIAANVNQPAQRFDRTIEGSGYLYGIVLDTSITVSLQGAAVANTEDAPWNYYNTIVLRDVNGELANLSGYNLYLANLIDKQYASQQLNLSTSAYLWTAPSVGAGATGGSTRFWLRVPVGLNRRDLIAILGNQDRAQKYNLRLDTEAPATYWATPPSGAGTNALVVINKFYENYAVPMPQTPQGQQQEIYPPAFGTLHFTTATLADSVPLGGSTVNHYLRRLGNTIRWIALVFRSGAGATPRATAETNRPTSIRFKVGEDTVFNETYEYRRMLMFERFGYDLPAGVLVYDALHDFGVTAGNEQGADYYHTAGLVNAQFQISYPAGFGAASNSLTIMTDDLNRSGAPIR